MALSRPVLLALVGALLVGALFFATMGSRQGASAPAPAPKPAAKNPDAAAKSKKQTAQAIPTAQAKAADKRRTPAAAKARAAQAEARAPKSGLKPDAAPSVGVPARVTRALARKHTVVLFFYQRGSADDDATAKAVRSVRGRPRVDVFSAPISRLADFRGITGDAGVSQAPAVVIIHGDHARLIEGFVDDATLAQEAVDAR